DKRQALVNALLETENQQLKKLNAIVLQSIEEEKLISEKIYEFEEKNTDFSSRLADRIALFGGSWRFILVFCFLIVTWMSINVYFLSRPFDSYPFILLNLVLSTVAALQAPIIMMSQNRKESKDRQRAINDYLVNLKAEIEVRNLHQKLDLLITEQMKTMFEMQQIQFEMMDEIKKAQQATANGQS
ncbi:MAG: DUF1003 domain-containing protein, partial [Chitinophagaceae bacterium]